MFQYTEAKLLQRVCGRPLLTMSSIRSVHDLHAFFNTIAVTAQSADSFTTDVVTAPSPHLVKSKSMPDFQQQQQHCQVDTLTARQFIERMVEKDFLDKMPAVK